MPGLEVLLGPIDMTFGVGNLMALSKAIWKNTSDRLTM